MNPKQSEIEYSPYDSRPTITLRGSISVHLGLREFVFLPHRTETIKNVA